MQMIGVGKLHLCAQSFQILRRNRTLDRSNGSDIHKNRCLDRTMHSFHYRTFCTSLLFQYLVGHLFTHLNLHSRFSLIYHPLFGKSLRSPYFFQRAQTVFAEAARSLYIPGRSLLSPQYRQRADTSVQARQRRRFSSRGSPGYSSDHGSGKRQRTHLQSD